MPPFSKIIAIIIVSIDAMTIALDRIEPLSILGEWITILNDTIYSDCNRVGPILYDKKKHNKNEQ